MMNFYKVHSALRRFRRDEDGLASIETILMLPLLMWAYVAGFTFFDAYRAQTDGLRATYAVADAIARETDPINDTYLNTTRRMFDFLAKSPRSTSLRVTIVCWSEQRQQYRVAWSRVKSSHGDISPHGHTSINREANRLPDFPYGDQLIVVETFTEFKPMLNVGIKYQRFEQFVPVRPRFTNQVKWQGQDKWVCKG